MNRHWQAVARPEAQPHDGFNLHSWSETESERLGKHGDDQCCLHHGEPLADALMRPPKKGEPGIARTCRLKIRLEAIGGERVGVGPEFRVTLGHVRADQDHRAGRDAEAAELIVCLRVARERHDRRVQP